MRSTSPGQRPSRAVLVLLLLASLHGDHPRRARRRQTRRWTRARSVVGDVFGPVENATAAAVRPFVGGARVLPHHRAAARRRRPSRGRELPAQGPARRRARWTATGPPSSTGCWPASKRTGYALVPARVVAMGPAQTFRRTVTIDAGTTSGVRPDMTVLEQRRPRGPGAPRRPLDGDRAAARRPGVRGRRAAGLEHGDRLPARPGRRRGRRPPRPRPRGPVGQRRPRTTSLVTWGSRNGAPYVAGSRSAGSRPCTAARASSPRRP